MTYPSKKSQPSMSQESPKTSPMNTDEALKSHCFWQNPNYLESTLFRRYQSNFSLGSQRFSAQYLMIPNPGFVNITSMTNTQDQHWTFKKELTKSDVDYVTCRRFILAKSFVEEHILKHLPPDDSQKINRGKPGITIKVYDHDTDTEHELCLAFQRSYVLKDGWLKTFIERRGLKEGDEVGLFWECSASKLHFSVLARAIAKSPTYR